MKTPKYVTKANLVLETIAAQPNRVWDKTQRELGQLLGINQAELSILVKMLIEQGRLRRGAPLRGVQGRNFVLETVNNEPLAGNVRRLPLGAAPVVRAENDRVLRPEEEIHSATIVDLTQLRPEQIGAAIVRALQSAWEKDEKIAQIRREYTEKTRDYRAQLSDERQLRIRLANDREDLKRRLEEKEQEMSSLRAEINRLLVRSHDRGGNTYQVRELLDEDELALLDNLMRSKPGHYRESDREIGLVS